MGQAKERKEFQDITTGIGTSFKDRRKASASGVGSSATNIILKIALQASLEEDRTRYQENKAKAKVQKIKKQRESRYLWDYDGEVMVRREKKEYGASASGVTYKHHSNIQKMNKRGR